jgi:hypothetical protein
MGPVPGRCSRCGRPMRKRGLFSGNLSKSFVEFPQLPIDRLLALLESRRLGLERVDRGPQLLNGISGRRCCIGLHAMGFKQGARPQRLDQLEDTGWQDLQSRTGVRIQLPGKTPSPFLQCWGNQIGTPPAHPIPHERHGRVLAFS